MAAWTGTFRTSGLDGWRLRNSPDTDTARRMVTVYASPMTDLMTPLGASSPELRAKLFQWYLDHVDGALAPEARSHAASGWCKHSDVPEIAAWCQRQGLTK